MFQWKLLVKSLFSNAARSNKSKPPRRKPKVRLWVEQMESRLVPSTIPYGTLGATITQNFSGLPVTIGPYAPLDTQTPPSDSGSQGPFDISTGDFPAGFSSSSLGGWYVVNSIGGNDVNLAEGEPTSTTGALFDFNNGTAGSQSLGTIATKSNWDVFGAIIQNTTGSTLTQFTLSYTGEEWWAESAGGTQQLDFGYQVSSSLQGLPPISQVNTSSDGTVDPNLNFVAPINSYPGGEDLDGTQAANQTTNIHDTITGLDWTPNTYLTVYWNNAQETKGDGLGIADFSFSAKSTPTVLPNTDNLPQNATSMTIYGVAFDPNTANDTVSFSNSVTGTVSSVNAAGTAMTVTNLTGLGSVATGTALKASVTADSISSGAGVQVGTVAAAATPTITATTDNIPSNALSMTINGTGFDINPSNDVVTFNNGVTGTVSAATTTSLSITNLSGVSSLANGTALKATVTVFGVSSALTQVGTIAAASTPTVTANTNYLLDNATSMTIAGTGFDTNAGNDIVNFDNGVTGTVTSATTTSLTVSNLSGLGSVAAGTALHATVTVDGDSSSSPVQVATVEAVTISYASAGSSYTQNFSSLPNNGTVATVVDGFGSPVQGPYDLATSGAFGASGLTGWYGANIATTPAPERFAEGEPNTTTGALYDFNDGTTGSQSLGMISTTTTASRFGALFVNNTGKTLTYFTLSYTGEEWWNNNGAGTSMNFSYQLGVTNGLPTSTPAGTMVPSLGFSAPNTSEAGSFIDAYTLTSYDVPVSGTVTNLSWAPGQTLAIFWDKGTGAGQSVGLGIQNLRFSATDVPTVTVQTANLAANSTTMTIAGFGFDPTAANNTVTFTNGIHGANHPTGMVSSVNAIGTLMTVTNLKYNGSSGFGTLTGSLTVVVDTDGVNSASTQVATISAAATPTVTSSSANLPNNATSMTINGTNFNTVATDDTVSFSNGVTGTVTSATTTSLTVGNLSGLSSVSPGTALNASVTVAGVSSGAAVEVATVAAATTVTPNTAGLSDEATSLTITGTLFDANKANDSVTFDNGVTGTITSATTTTLTVGSLSGLNVVAAGTALHAVVTSDGVSSNSVQIATVAAATIGYSSVNGNYTQSFSTLSDAGGEESVPTTGTGSPVEGPYDLTSSLTGAFGASGLNGWYAENLATGNPELFDAGEPFTTTGSLFDFNDGTAGSQALGTISTSSTASRFGAIFVNNTGVPLTQFSLSYTGEEWWDEKGNGTSLNFGFELGVSSMPSDVGTQIPSLGFTALVSGGVLGNGVYVDGATTDQVPVSGTVTGIYWTPGETLAIFWDKGAGASSSDGLGVANVKFSALLAPTVTPTTNGLPQNATTLAIVGSGFDQNTANDTVTFSNGVTGTVSSVNSTGTSMTVNNLHGLSSVATGTALMASVTIDGVSSGSAVQVATIVASASPTVTANTNNLPSNAASMAITGTGFDMVPGNDVVTFSNGVTGTVTSATSTSLIVSSLSGLSSLINGTALTASVAVYGVSSGVGVQVGTVAAASTPTVTSSTANLLDNATSMTIAGTGFDTNPANDLVTFDNGVTGTVTSASTTSLTVGNLTGLNIVGAGTALHASVAVFGISSSGSVQVATVAPVTISYTGSTYTQNFSTLPDAGGAATIVDGTGSPAQGPYDLTAAGALGASGLSGWYATNLYSLNPEKFGQGEPSTTTGALFDFNDGTAGSQSLGTISTTTTSSRFGALLVNNTGQTLTQFSLGYTGEEWWDNDGQGTSMNFSYELGATGLPTSTGVGTLVPSLGFTAPNSSDTGTYVDGYTTSAYQVPVSGTVTGISWAPGETLAIFWDKGTGAATSDGLAIANMSFTTSSAITPTVSVTDAGGTYNGQQYAATNASATANSTTIASFGSPTLSYQYYQGSTLLSSAPTTAGAYSVVAVYTSNNPSYTNATSSPVGFTIGQEAITIAASNQTQTYGSVNLGTSAYTITSGALQSGDSITSVTLTALDINSLGMSGSGNDNVGVWGITASGATGTGGFDTTNYNISYAPGFLTINPLALTVTGISGTNQAYNGTTNDPLTGTPVLTGAIGGDSVSLTGTGVGTLASENAGSEAVTVSGYGLTGSDSNNYTLSSFAVPAVTISPEAITITAGNQTQTYGSISLGTSAFSVTSGAVQTGDSITGVTLTANDINSLGKSGSGNDNVGAWGINASAAAGTGGFNTTNYSISYASGSLTINTRALTLTGISGTNKVYDGTTNDPLTGSPLFSGNVTGDSIALGGTGVGTLAAATVGTEPVTISGYSVTGSDAHDYNFSEPSVPAITVSKATPVITWANPADIKVGTKLSATQLDAKANVSGTFVYNPTSGSTPTEGLFETLSTTFTPTDTTDYTTATDSVLINVWPISVTPKTTSVKASVATLTISGYGFSTTASNDIVTFSGSTTGTVTTATATSLTVSVSNLVGGTLMASVENTALSGTFMSNGIPANTTPMEQVATITPVVTTSTATVLATATSLVINGFGFSTTPGNNVVTFSGGTTGIVTSATATQLTVTGLTGLLAGKLDASVTTNGSSSGTAVEVASVAPVVTMNTTSINDQATATLTINGYGFTTGSTVKLTGAGAGTVTVVSANEIMVVISKMTVGPVTAVVTSSSVSSGAAVQVATVLPIITTSTTSISPTATSLTINGLGFSTTVANDLVTIMFADGTTVTESPTTATSTKLTMKLTGTHAAGAVTAYVTVNGLYTSQTEEVAVVS